MTDARFSGTALIYSIHRSWPWWSHVGKNLGYEKSFVVSDLRGEGDYNVVDDFYSGYQRHYAVRAESSALLTVEQIEDVIARCRVLRWLPRRKAAAMALAMADAFETVLDATNPTLVVSWPMDRYVSDVLDRLARARGIPYFEMTISALPDRIMLMYRGKLLTAPVEIDPTQVKADIAAFTDKSFTPSYVANQKPYTAGKFLKVFGYFQLRGWVFRAMSLMKRDLLNLHYLDSQGFLGHKPHIGDIGMLRLMDHDWAEKIARFDRSRRLFLPLQLFPEASIDYWINDVELIHHEDLLVEVAQVFSAVGYAVVVKDHPLQFGFRQIDLIKRLRAIPNVVIVPYGVSGDALLSECQATFSCTGTLGLQAALLGLTAITTQAYFTTPDDFVIVHRRADVASLPERIEAFPVAEGDALKARQQRIVRHLMSGSFPGDFMSYKRFDPATPSASATALGVELGCEMERRRQALTAQLG